MLALTPSEPLLAPVTREPPGPDARLSMQGVHQRPTAAGMLAIYPPTGAWAYLSADEVTLLTWLEGRARRDLGHRDAPRLAHRDALVDALWRRGILAADGRRAIEAVDFLSRLDAQIRDTFCMLFLLSSSCNLACTYCYLSLAQSTGRSRLDLETGRAALRELVSRPEPRLVVDFGEIAGLEPLFRALATDCHRYAHDAGRDVTMLVQTNGTRLNPGLLAFFAAHGVATGLSVDGPAHLNDRARQFHNGRGSHAQADEGLRLLGRAGLPHWVLVTVGQHNIAHPREVVDYLWERRVGDFAVKPVLRIGEATRAWHDVGVSSQQLDPFVRDLVAHCLGRGVDALDLTRRKHLLRALGDVRGWGTGCTSRRCACGDRWTVVEHDGTRSPCPRFAGIREDGGAATAAGTPACAGGLPADCVACPWQSGCQGGCTLSGDVDPECDVYKLTYELIFTEIIPQIFARDELASRHVGPLERVEIGESTATADGGGPRRDDART